MTPTPLDLPLLFDALLGSAVGELLGGLLELGSSELAWAGESVSVVGGGGGAPVPLPLLGRMNWPSVSTTVSTNATVGPATTAWVWRTCRLLASGWLSGVIHITTGPLMPSGTVQLLIGCDKLTGMPPMSIWQLKFCGRTTCKREIESGGAMRGTVLTVVSVLALRAAELNCNCVPGVRFPVLVTESGTLASYAVRGKQRCGGGIRNLTQLVEVTHSRVMPVSQDPVMNPPAMARTSPGSKGMSNACGAGVAPCIKFRIVWWRDSSVTMEPAAARTAGS
jgi:hypothetical protein